MLNLYKKLKNKAMQNPGWTRLENYNNLLKDYKELKTKLYQSERVKELQRKEILTLEESIRLPLGMKGIDLIEIDALIDNIHFTIKDSVPRLVIDGQDVGVVSASYHFVTKHSKAGTNVLTVCYIKKGKRNHHVVSIDLDNKQVFSQ